MIRDMLPVINAYEDSMYREKIRISHKHTCMDCRCSVICNKECDPLDDYLCCVCLSRYELSLVIPVRQERISK